MNPTINIITKAARRAGRLIVRAIDRVNTLNIEQKGHHDFVTEIDRKAEVAIIEVLRETYPDYNILSEEVGRIEGASGDSEYTFIIDPLDGTTNFIHGFPFVAVSIALQHKDIPLHAVVYDPIHEELFMASQGSGAYLNDRRIRVTNCGKLDDALLGTGFPSKQIQHFKSYIKMFESIFPQASGLRRAGAAALDLAYVAAGRLDGFWEVNLQPWDMAAGALLIQEAGGFVTDLQGDKDFIEKHHIVAAAPKLHKTLLAQLQQALKE